MASNKFFCCFFSEAKGDRNALHELWDEYVLGTGNGPAVGNHCFKVSNDSHFDLGENVFRTV